MWPLVVLALPAVAARLDAVLGRGVRRRRSSASVVADGALFDDGDPSRAYYGTDARAHTLLIGALLALLLLVVEARRDRRRG